MKKLYEILCSVDDCEESHHAKGYCQFHYYRFALYGDPCFSKKRSNNPDTCTIPGCDKPYEGLGFCSPHRQRLKRTGGLVNMWGSLKIRPASSKITRHTLQRITTETPMYQDNPRVVRFTGTVSSATMRAEDLLPKFAYVLEKYGMKRSALKARAAARLLEWQPDDLDTQILVSMALHDDIWQAMNEIAPEGYYFGTHEGDGADCGFWLAEEF